jgi:hypothetical protein
MPMEKTYLINSSGSTEFSSGGEYAIVTFSEAAIKTIALRRKLFLAAKEQDPELEFLAFTAAIEFFKCPTFTRHVPNLGSDEEMDGADMLIVENSSTTKPFVEVDSSWEWDEESATCTDCDRMYLDANGIWFMAFDHYNSDTYNTEPIPYEKLFEGVL